MKKEKPNPQPPPDQHPLVEIIRIFLVDKINESNRVGKIPIRKIADMCGMSHQFIAAFKTNRRCVKEFPLDSFFKLTDGLKIDRGEMVKPLEDILTPKLKKVLDGVHRQLFNRFLDALIEATPNQLEILNGVVETIYHQIEEKESLREISAR